MPFPVNSFLGIVERTGKSQPTSPKSFRSEIETDLEHICLKCLQREPERRYAYGEELEADLGKYLDGKPIAGKLPSVSEQVLDWIRQPGRVFEAGAFSLIINAIMSLWVVANLVITYPVLTQAEMKQSVITSILIISLVHVPLCFTGFFAIRFNGKAIIAGMMLSIVPLLMALLTVFGYPGPFEDDYHSNPRLGIPLHYKQVLFGLLTFLCFLQTAYYGIAMLSHHRRKTRI